MHSLTQKNKMQLTLKVLYLLDFPDRNLPYLYLNHNIMGMDTIIKLRTMNPLPHCILSLSYSLIHVAFTHSSV